MINTDIDSLEDLTLRSFGWVNNSRYYNLYIQQDLFGRISIIKFWGSRVSNKGGHQIITCNSTAEAIEIVNQVAAKRKQREYYLTNTTS